MNEHISSAYDRDLEQIQTLVLKMGGMVEDAISLAARSLETRDLELAEKVRAADKDIDAMELQINEEAARIIALRAPVSKDLRAILIVLRIAASMERIGDYAKNMAKRTGTLADMPHIPGSDAALRRMAREVQSMLKDFLESYLRLDVVMADEVRMRDHEVDEMYNALFREFLTFMMEDPRNITTCMHLHFMAKNVERMGDLVTNMAEQVIYLVTGELPEEARPKGDNTSFMAGLS
jgi:phosphate transport system protein